MSVLHGPLVFLHFILNYLPSGIIALLIAVIISAAMSSTASEINALAATTTIDIYKRILLDNREYLALNVYVALCYYKLDYYDVSQEVLAVYLQHFPDSAIAINLKACNHFR